jgi:Phosphate-selective porin O and P
VEGMKPNSTMSDSDKVSGNSKMVLWNVVDKWQVAVREDIYDPDVNNDLRGTDNLTNSKQDKMMYGVNYQWFADLKLQLDYSNLKYDGGVQASTVKNARYEESQTVLQAVWSF